MKAVNALWTACRKRWHSRPLRSVPALAPVRRPERSAVLRVLDSRNCGQPREPRCEPRGRVVRLPGASGTAALTNGTAPRGGPAALDVGQGDEVIIPPGPSWPRSAPSLRPTPSRHRRTVDYTRHDRRRAAAAAITGRTRAIIPVHLGGACGPRRPAQTSTEHGLVILEDAAQAHGSTWHGQHAGRSEMPERSRPSVEEHDRGRGRRGRQPTPR